MQRKQIKAWLLAVLLGCGSALAADYTESIDGDLSNDRLAPTRLVLSYGGPGASSMLGANIITGTLGNTPPGTIDRDYLNFRIPAGFVLSELRVGQQTTVGGGGSFIGLAAGTTMPVAPDAPDATGLLGWRVYQLSDRGTDILDNMQTAGNGASGFERPLVSGEYTLWLQELASGTFNYRFNLLLSPVPEASTLSLMAAGALCVVLAARRRRSAAHPTSVDRER